MRQRMRARLFGGLYSDAGWGLVELTVALFLFALLSVGVVATLGASLRTFTLARTKTFGEQIATTCIEDMRSLHYDDIGIVGGNPGGTLASSTSTTRHGVAYTIQRGVKYVNDPIPGGAVTNADYKEVTAQYAADPPRRSQVSKRLSLRHRRRASAREASGYTSPTLGSPGRPSKPRTSD